MSKSAFAQTIISKLKGAIGTDGLSFGANTASAAMQAVADGITEYLIANTKVDIAYVGMIPGSPPTPDPTIKDTFKIVGKCTPPSVMDNFGAWLRKIESNIIAGFSLAPAGTAGVVFPQKPFAVVGITTTQLDLKTTHSVGDESPQQKVWEVVCGGIMDWVNTVAKNTASGAATHPSASSSGTANIVKITLT